MSRKMACPECGGEITIEEYGDLERYNCPKCPYEGGATVCRVHGDLGTRDLGPVRVKVRVHWRDRKVTPRQAVLVRKSVPALAQKGLSAILAESANSPTYELGEMPTFEADELRAKVRELGIEITYEPVDS